MKKKLKEILDKIFPNIPYDKKLHFLAGFIIAMACGFVFNTYTALLAAVCAGIAKEIYDLCDYGVFDWKDMIATWIGGCVGFMVFALINYWR